MYKKINFDDFTAASLHFEAIVRCELKAAVNKGDIGFAMFAAGELAMLERMSEKMDSVVNNRGQGLGKTWWSGNNGDGSGINLK